MMRVWVLPLQALDSIDINKLKMSDLLEILAKQDISNFSAKGMKNTGEERNKM